MEGMSNDTAARETGGTAGGKGGGWQFFDRVKGDKVVWIVVLLLIMISLTTISGSTSMLALQSGTTRVSLFSKHLLVCAGGLALIFFCYFCVSMKWFERLSKYGFIVSFLLLGLLLLREHFNIAGVIKAEYLNGAWRTIRVWKIQIHVFEVVKVAMVMYLAWACKTFRNDGFTLSKKLAAMRFGKERDKTPFSFMNRRLAQFCFYILVPVAATAIMILPGGNSSAIYIGLVMGATMVFGRVDFKYIVMTAVVGVALLGAAYGIYRLTGGEWFERIGTALSRSEEDPTPDDLFRIKAEKGELSKEYKRTLQKLQQPYSAKIAIHEGGLLGKGIGGSTQKYVVPQMYGDFMFSFILEETGLLGGIAIIILYLSLLARGSRIVVNSDDDFAKTAAGGLALMIAGQAFMHILINLDAGPLTGQTLPMISHGSSSFLCFSLAFGILLAMSKTAKTKTAAEERKIDLERGRPVEEEISSDSGDF